MRLLHAGRFVFVAICFGLLGADVSASEAATDPFLWLEDIEGDRALAWVRAQNERALAQLKTDPRYERNYTAALAILEDKSRIPFGTLRKGWMHNFWQDDRNVRGLWRRARLESYQTGAPQWETLLDLDALARSENSNWVWEGASCLPDSERCMLALSNGGKDARVHREFDLDTRAFVDGGFVLPEAKASLAWEEIDTLLVATDWGPGTLGASGYPFIVKRWKRGTPLAAAREIHRGQPEDAGVSPFRMQGQSGKHLIGIAENDTFFTTTYYVLDVADAQRAKDTAPKVVRLSVPPKSTLQGLYQDQLLVTLAQDWALPSDAQATASATESPHHSSPTTWQSGSLISIPLTDMARSTPMVHAVLTPGPRDSIQGVSSTGAGVLVAKYSNVRGRILRYGFDGKRWTSVRVPLPDNGTVGIAAADADNTAAFVTYEDFLQPTTLYTLAVDANRTKPIKNLPAQFDSGRFLTEQFAAVSKDGTHVPYFVVRSAKTQLNGKHPTLLYGYGGFQLSMLPSYSGTLGKLWLEQGGIYVLANIRGGGEFGPAWHDAGLKTRRQVIYDDFFAVAEDLIRRRITSVRHLGIQGESNGGLLMGVALTQRPELFGAAVVKVPLLDMLRFHQLLAGASWVDEYGSPDVPEERAWLEQISPYHRLRKHDDFPLPFIMTSTKDDRVHPGHARKFSAKMAALSMPFLYYENVDGGHSAAANLRESARRAALEFTYLAQQLFMPAPDAKPVHASRSDDRVEPVRADLRGSRISK